MTLDAALGQIVPVLDALGIALAHQEHDRRSVGRSIERQPLLPIRRKPAFGRNGVDVIGERQRDDIRLQAVDHRARLRAGPAMRLLDLDALAGLLLISSRERLVEVGIEFARRIIRHVEQRNIGGERRARPQQSHEERQNTTDHLPVSIRPDEASHQKHGAHNSRPKRLKSTKPHFNVCGGAAALCYDVFVV